MNDSGLPSAHTIEVERTANNARILEIALSFFSIYGTGWLYAGNLTPGIIGLVLSALIIFPLEITVISATGGICCCIVFPINIALGVVSGNNARAWALTNRKTQGSILYVVVGIAAVVAVNIVISILVFTVFAGLIGGLSILDALSY